MDMSRSGRFETIVTKCHLRALSVEKEFLLCGMGSTLHILRTTRNGINELISSQIIFKTHVINGIKTFINFESDSYIEIIVSIYGNRFLSIYKFIYNHKNSNHIFNGLLESHNFYDWILAVQMTRSLAFVVKAHNQVVIFDWQSKQIIDTISGVDRSLLYSAELLHVSESPKGFVLTSGTVFKQIVIWSSFTTQTDNQYEVKCQQRLEGHDGVIFALNYNKALNLLVSASDDRSVRIWSSQLSSDSNLNPIEFWDKNKFTLSHVFYGHLSRIWKVVSICDPYPIVISVGEDSSIYFWNINNNKLIQKVDGHKNSSVWSLALDSQSMICLSGGSDSCITCTDVKNIITPFSSQVRYDLQPKQIKFIAFQNLSIFCAAVSGDFVITSAVICNNSANDIKNSDYNKVFKTYSAIDVNEDRNQLVLGSKCGNIAIVDLNAKSDKPYEVSIKKAHNSKVFSVNFVDSSHCMSCGFDGEMKVWSLKTLEVIRKHVLPNSRHRWPVAALLTNELVVVGDRCGSVFVYTSQSEQPINEFRHLHGTNGVTAIKMKPKTNLMYSSGRNGKIVEFLLEDKNCILLRVYRIFADMEWIGNFCFDANTHQMSYIYGFDSRNFVVWDEREQRFIESIDCGGGHRSWDFVVHQNRYYFCYTKQENMYCYDKQMSKIRVNSDLMVSKMSHSKKINCCSLLFTTSSMYFATAGEENVIHINSLDMKTHAFQIELYLFGHISNISAITCSSPKKCPNTCYMVSVGGRTQLMLWFIEIKDKNLFCKQLLNKFLWDSNDMHNRTKDMKTCSPEDPQIRYLDANMCQISDDQYLISTACSDSAFRLYVFDSNLLNLQILKTTSVNTSCVLRVLNAFKSHVITASNDGTLKIWSLMEGYLDKLLADDLQSKPIELNSVFEMRTHEAGINALDICLLNVTDDLWLIASGGDDNALVLSLFKHSNNNLMQICCTQEKYKHSSQITGIKILSRNRILSAAIDQRIILWKYELDSEELCLNLEPISSHVSSIADISSLLTTFVPQQNKWQLIVCGEGFEALKYSIN